MTMNPGIVLVHGYTGSPRDLDLLRERLIHHHGPDSVTAVGLPGHGDSGTPPLDEAAFEEAIVNVVDRYTRAGKELILVGFSTGGTLLLSAINRHSWSPRLLILAATPKRVDLAHLARWSRHGEAGRAAPFTTVAKMMSLINRVGSLRFSGTFPVLILQGDKDALVLPEEAYLWLEDSFEGPVDTLLIEGADHHVFGAGNDGAAVDAVAGAIHDVLAVRPADEDAITGRLVETEGEAGTFLGRSPGSAHHLALSPSGQVLAGLQPLLSSRVSLDPVFANIEITTRCSLRCRYCARSFVEKPTEDMEEGTFLKILDCLPHAYRVTLVGLGEPLLHPGVVGFVNEATSRGRRVGIVTNGLHLDGVLSESLIEAGLRSIAFSIDTPDEATAADVRGGSDLPRVVENLKGFMERVPTSLESGISTAIFAAVSIRTAPMLEKLVDLSIDCGVHALMLTDLNFAHYLSDSLWKNLDDALYNDLCTAISRAFRKGLPLLSVHGLEEFGLRARYRHFLLLSPNQLCRRSQRRKWCFSPWQTMSVDVKGNVTICDCQPEAVIGNLFVQPFETIWNGKAMVNHRQGMMTDTPPTACRTCPRF